MRPVKSKARKILLRSLAVLGVAILLIFALVVTPFVRPAAAFFSHRAEITKLIETADPQDKSLPQPVHDLLLLSLHGDTGPSAARRLLWQFDRDATTREGKWLFAYASWGWLVDLDMTEQERETVIATISPGGDRFSLNGMAIKMFGKPLSGLSVEQATSLIIHMDNPSDQTLKLFGGIKHDQLLARYHQQHAVK